MGVAIQTVQGNFSLRANSLLCQSFRLYGKSSVFRLNLWARRYSPTADNPGARLQPTVGASKRKATLHCLNCRCKGSGSVCFCSGSLEFSVWAGNVQPTYREMAAIDNFQYMPVVGIERLIDTEQKQTDPLPITGSTILTQEDNGLDEHGNQQSNLFNGGREQVL